MVIMLLMVHSLCTVVDLVVNMCVLKFEYYLIFRSMFLLLLLNWEFFV